MNEEGTKRTIQQLLDIFIEPEIKKRQEAGLIEKPFPLKAAQIIFQPVGGPPEVRLNKEVKAQLRVKLKDEYIGKIKTGGPIFEEQIESIEATGLPDDEDLDVGHATIMNIGGNWLLHFDFIYNKGKITKHIETAAQFLSSAKDAFLKEHWSPLIEALCSASELTAKAYLLSMPDKTVIDSKSHGVVASKTNIHRQLGNLKESHVDAYNKVWVLRKHARYLEGELNISKDEAKEIINDIEEFIETIRQRTSFGSN